eukprot:CAMPEP_0197027396 /NCGR_PEP_ID=MMETSP1384-20130603/7306_1 /TAXON_ID=29189 /ORGANISM="Ammonia sp." /LENGTH=760 /DNA_ID=CAMNT_0042456231 /DNA_START=38 /DNA_END=2320 /DNA_ORIENTATION=+
MDDEFYNFRSMEHDTGIHDGQPEPISMEPNYQHYQQLKEPANVLFDYYNNPNVSFSTDNFAHHHADSDDDDNIDHLLSPDQYHPDDPKMVMIRQINDDGKDWSEEEVSDLETDAKNDTLPPASVASTNRRLHAYHQAHHHHDNSNPLLPAQHGAHLHKNNDPNQPIFVNVNDLINTIGFGKFHYQLIFLCGLGYIADSMWTEAITLIINPVQMEWDIDTQYLGWLAATLFSGMCVGSFVWGRTSDVVGRKFPFTLTLTIGGIMGMIAAFMPNFQWLLILLLCLGFGVGGNIPVDGAILAEFLPTSHRGSIMVSLSIFWAAGDLIAAFLAYLIIPDRICHDRKDCQTEHNLGWRYFIFALGAINCCFLFFRLGTNESPNYLICQGEGGRRRALSVLKRIAEINQCPKNTVSNNMILQVDNPLLNRKLIKKLKNKQRLQHNLNRQRLLNEHDQNVSIQNNGTRRPSSLLNGENKSHKSKTNSFESIPLGSTNEQNNNNPLHSQKPSKSDVSSLSPLDSNDVHENGNDVGDASFNNMNVNIDLDLEARSMSWSEVISELFSNKTHGRNLRRATPIIWIAWFASSMGLSSFGVFLPKFMSAKKIHISSVYGDALILAIASLPGPFISAYLVETHRFGRRYTMTVSGICLSAAILLFIFVNNETGLVILACLISLLTQIWFAGLMCFTPEAYPTDIRTTASGIATAIRHVANILGPIIAGATFGSAGHTPLIMSSLALLCAGTASYFLPFDTRKKRLVPTVRVSL